MLLIVELLLLSSKTSILILSPDIFFIVYLLRNSLHNYKSIYLLLPP